MTTKSISMRRLRRLTEGVAELDQAVGEHPKQLDWLQVACARNIITIYLRAILDDLGDIEVEKTE